MPALSGDVTSEASTSSFLVLFFDAENYPWTLAHYVASKPSPATKVTYGGAGRARLARFGVKRLVLRWGKTSR